MLPSGLSLSPRHIQHVRSKHLPRLHLYSQQAQNPRVPANPSHALALDRARAIVLRAEAAREAVIAAELDAIRQEEHRLANITAEEDRWAKEAEAKRLAAELAAKRRAEAEARRLTVLRQQEEERREVERILAWKRGAPERERLRRKQEAEEAKLRERRLSKANLVADYQAASVGITAGRRNQLVARDEMYLQQILMDQDELLLMYVALCSTSFCYSNALWCFLFGRKTATAGYSC
jgi:hypothetical protein